MLKREEAMRGNLQDDRKQVNQGEKKVVEVMVEVVTREWKATRVGRGRKKTNMIGGT